MARFQVPPPPYTPAVGGLLDVATLRDESDPHWQLGIDWEALCAGPAAATQIDCEDDTPPWTSEPTGFPGVEGWLPFQVYHQHACSPVGRTLDEHEALATEALTRGEGRAIEAVLERGGVTDDGSLGTIGVSLAANAEDITGTATPIVEAIAALEQALGWRYGGQGVIHLSRALATLAASAQVLVSAGQGRYRTALGTPVAVGTGYFGSGPSGVVDGQSVAYATGPVVIYRGAVQSLGIDGTGLDRDVNTLELTVSRSVVVGWDCVALAATVDHDVPTPPEPVS